MAATEVDGVLTMGGSPLERVVAALRRLEPHASACYAYDLDAVAARAARFMAAFAPLRPLCAYTVKANGLPALLERVRRAGMGAEAGSLGELEWALAAGFDPTRMVLNGNGRTAAEAAWVARRVPHSINADHIGELDLLQSSAAREGTTLRVALRVNPGIATPGHHHVATGHEDAKFGVSPEQALEAWGARARWPNLRLDGVHLHVGSQLLDPAPLDRALDAALGWMEAAAHRGAPLGLVNLGGGFGVDYDRPGREFPIEAHAERLIQRVSGIAVDWVFEPGRWVVATEGVLLAEVLWIKPRDGRRFVVLGAGMNDFLRPALYGARHRIVPLRRRPGALEPAAVVGPVCESSDVFDDHALLPPLERGDWVALLDAGAYGACMSSHYNGRGRIAELVRSGGAWTRARAGETVPDPAARATADPLEL
jgi:diaminopimelate decarboxylase